MCWCRHDGTSELYSCCCVHVGDCVLPAGKLMRAFRLERVCCCLHVLTLVLLLTYVWFCVFSCKYCYVCASEFMFVHALLCLHVSCCVHDCCIHFDVCLFWCMSESV